MQRNLIPDLIDQLTHLAAHQSTHTARHERAKVVAATQGSYDALFAPSVAGISVQERLLVALLACRLSKSAHLAGHYQERLQAEGAAAQVLAAVGSADIAALTDARLQAILRFTATLIQRPLEGDRQAIAALQGAGLSTPAIVALGQLIAFLSYQIRLVSGLQAMAAAEENAEANAEATT